MSRYSRSNISSNENLLRFNKVERLNKTRGSRNSLRLGCYIYKVEARNTLIYLAVNLISSLKKVQGKRERERERKAQKDNNRAASPIIARSA